jgi:hypothetical protein
MPNGEKPEASRTEFPVFADRPLLEVGQAASFRRDVWIQAGWSLVGFDEPSGAVAEVAEELLIVWETHFAGPDDLGVVDIGAVVHPLSVNVMVGRVADDRKLAAGEAFEVAQDLGAIEVAGIGRIGVGNDSLT